MFKKIIDKLEKTVIAHEIRRIKPNTTRYYRPDGKIYADKDILFKSPSRYFYDENGNEIKSVDYSILMNHVRDDADKTVNLLWFDDVTIENMAKSFGVFLESMNYEEEE